MARPKKGEEKYKPEYCEELIEHMKEGYSFSSFGANCECSAATLCYWVKTHDDFAHAKSIGEVHNLKHWEKLSHSKMDTGKWIFNMKNRFGWMDKREVNQHVTATIGKFDHQALLEAVKSDPFMKVKDVTETKVEVKDIVPQDRTVILDVPSTGRQRNYKKKDVEA